MARDYKSRSGEPKKSGSLLPGILIGVLVGIVIAIGIALWVNGSNPFRQAEPPATGQTENNAGKKSSRADDAPPTNGKPRFDFYNILPGDEAAMTDRDLYRNPVPPAGELYYLQAGAFPNSAEADNLKAQLALLGYEASIQTAEIPGKGIWHRVRLGPYSALNELNKTRAALAQNQIPSNLIRVKNASANLQSNPTQ